VDTQINVTVNPRTLITLLDYQNPNPKVINDLKLLLSNNTEDLSFIENNFSISWHDLKKNLVSISRLLKRYQVKLNFDELGLKLVSEFISDRNNLKKQSLQIPNIEDFQSLLKSIGFNRELKPEQERDVLKLLSLKHGANFSVPGAGKTTTILAVHSILKHYNQVSKLFVVCPVNAFISWEEEIKSIFSSSISVLRLTSLQITQFGEVLKQNPDVILVNYEKLRKDPSSLISYFFENYVHLILDESHRIKSGTNNLSYSQIIKISDLAKRRDILSGTPMPQSYLDLQPQLDFLWPNEKIIPDASDLNEDTKIVQVNDAIKNLYVRTTKNELGLKDPEISYTRIKMGSLQTQLYKLFKSETARVLSRMDTANKNTFRKIGRSVVRLLQAATNPMLLGIKDEYYDETLPVPDDSRVWELLEEFIKYEKPNKIEYLKGRVAQLLTDNSDTKIVIWSYFVRNIQLLERIFKNYNPVSIYGGISTGSDEDDDNRESRIRKFHADKTCRLMIANPQACGEGISLHKVCHYAIYLDRNFNAAHFLQSIDRIHRLGLDSSIDTKVEILVSDNTIDEVLIYRLNEKIQSMGKILDDPYLKTMAYDPADIPIAEEDGLDTKDIEEIKKHISSNE
jgi:hypothetical protein